MRNHAKPTETKPLIDMQGMNVAGYYGIELHDFETEASRHLQRMLYQLVTDVLSPPALFHGIAGVGDVTAATHIIRVQDIKTDELPGFTVHGNARVGLACEEWVSRLLVQLL